VGKRVYVDDVSALFVRTEPLQAAKPTMNWPSAGRNFHWAASGILILGLVPVFHHLGVPLRFAWVSNLAAYWIGLGGLAILVSLFLYTVQFPGEISGPQAQIHDDACCGPINRPDVEGGNIRWRATYSWGLHWSRHTTMQLYRSDSSANIDPLARSGLTPGCWAAPPYPRFLTGLGHFPLSHFHLGGPHLLFDVPLVGALLYFTRGQEWHDGGIALCRYSLTAYYLALLIFLIMPIEGPFFYVPGPFRCLPEDAHRLWNSEVDAHPFLINCLDTPRFVLSGLITGSVFHPCMSPSQ